MAWVEGEDPFMIQKTSLHLQISFAHAQYAIAATVSHAPQNANLLQILGFAGLLAPLLSWPVRQWQRRGETRANREFRRETLRNYHTSNHQASE